MYDWMVKFQFHIHLDLDLSSGGPSAIVNIDLPGYLERLGTNK